jgi:Ca-activated chloride channel homolog
MQFAFPAALWLLPLALLPLLARRTRPVRRLPVATMPMWAAAAAREAAPVARRLRRHWLAIVQALVVVALVLAIARPQWPTGSNTVAIVVDTSLSMSAVSGGQSRLVQGTDRALSWARDLPSGTRIRLVTTSPTARAAGEYSVGDVSFESALAALQPSAAGGSLDAAIALAHAGNPSPSRALVVTDAASLTDRAGTEWATVGAAADNAAVVTLAARRAHATAPETDVVAHVFNYGSRALTTTLAITHDGRVVSREPLVIPARSGTSASVLVREPDGLVTATIDAADAIAADNTRSTLIAPPLAVRVAVVGRGNPTGFLERALRSRAGIEVGADASRADVVVCSGCSADDATTIAKTIANTALLVVPPVPAAPTAPAPLHTVGRGAPLRTAASLAGVEAVVIEGGAVPPDAVVASAASRPAIVASEVDGRRVIELRLDLDRSALALAPAFPMLVADAIDWLAGRDFQEATFEAGVPAVRPLPSGEGPVTVLGPTGAVVASAIASGRLTIAGADAAGVYHVRRGSAEAPFVVNPVTSGESDLGTSVATTSPTSATAPLDAGRLVDITPFVIAIALALIAIESRVRPGRWRSRRGLAVGLLAVAFAAPRVPWGEAPRAIVFALDVSDSMEPRRGGALAVLRDGTAGMRRGDRAGLVVFGADGAVERPLDAAPLAGAAPAARTVGSATDLERALRTARAALAETAGGRVVLVSDGRATTGEAAAEAMAARAAGVAIDVIAPRSTRPSVQRFSVTRVAAPPTVHQGEPFDVVATIEGAPGAATTVVFDGGGDPQRRSVTLPASGTASVAMTIRAGQPGLTVYRASVDAGDVLGDFAGEPAGAVVAVEGDARLLHVGTGAPVFTPPGYVVERTTPESAPRATERLAGFDAVVLDDVAPEQLDDAQRLALAQHVERGGGLFVLGGPRSLVPPGAGDPLEAALPIDLRPRRGQRAPGLALVIVFDKSGSMDDRIDGAPRIEFARQAVERVLTALPPTDAVGVIAFDAGAVDVVPLRPGHDAATLAQRLAAVRPSGATAIGPALERAASWLRDPAAAGYARRLVLLVSDGRTSPADQARAHAALQGSGIEVSTVALGEESDRRFLGTLASAAGGRAFYPRRLGELPALAAREAVRVSGGQTVNERFTVQAARHPLLAGLDAALPQLGGYVVATAKPGAEVVLRSPLGDPVLATWRRGLGKVAIYTADLRSSWSDGLRGWRDGGRLLAQATRWVSRRVDHPFLYTEIVERGGTLTLTVEARDGSEAFLNRLDVRAQSRAPDGATTELVLVPSGPGLYVGEVPAREPGPYLFSIAATAADGSLDARVQRGLYWTPVAERPGDVDAAALTAIARLSGGRELREGDDPFDGPRLRDRRSIGPWLAGVALLLFLGDVLGLTAARLRRGPATTDISHKEAA